MTSNQPKNQLLKELLFIIGLSIILAFAYNFFSGKGIPIIREQIQKITVGDSILFRNSFTNDSTQQSIPQDIKVIAPLHERALKNPDSMARLYGNKKSPIYKIITLNQLTRLLSENKGVLLDARNSEEYEKGHIKGARNIPALDVENHFESLLTLPRDTLILVYCNGPECHLGHMLADFLVKLEFKHIFIYDGGWDEWINSKMPIDTTMKKD